MAIEGEFGLLRASEQILPKLPSDVRKRLVELLAKDPYVQHGVGTEIVDFEERIGVEKPHEVPVIFAINEQFQILENSDLKDFLNSPDFAEGMKQLFTTDELRALPQVIEAGVGTLCEILNTLLKQNPEMDRRLAVLWFYAAANLQRNGAVGSFARRREDTNDFLRYLLAAKMMRTFLRPDERHDAEDEQ